MESRLESLSFYVNLPYFHRISLSFYSLKQLRSLLRIGSSKQLRTLSKNCSQEANGFLD